MAFTEFCAKNGGSNLNAGTRTGNSTEPGTAADFTYASGSWVSSTGVFTVASGNPVTDGVAVGDFASVYADGASATTLVGRVTARTSTTITVSTTAKSGTTTDGTSNRTLKIGGAWQGPNGTSSFPLGFLTTSCTNASGNIPRINLKNDAAFSVTAGVTSNASGPFTVQGYTTSYGDGGKALLQGPSTGSAVTTLTLSTSTSQTIRDLVVTGTGATGAGDCINITNQYTYLRGVVAYGARGRGFVIASSNISLIECEAYGNNVSNSAGYGGISQTAGASNVYVRCIAHDNTGSNAFGFQIDTSATLFNCISDSNGSHGFNFSSSTVAALAVGCDAYNNGGSGFTITSRYFVLENCNSIKNTGWGFLATGSSLGTFHNCGVGSGTQANGSGTYSLSSSLDSVVNGVTYASDVTPWTDPANGDFRISLAAAKGVGRGSFCQYQAGYAGAVGYPDIGAAQSTGSGGAIGGGNLTGGFQ